MPKQNQNLIRKVVKVHPQQQQMLDIIIEKWGYTSESEVVRAAIAFFYKKWDPAYLQPSSREKERLEQQREAQKMENMPNEDFVLNVMKAYLRKDKKGNTWVLSHNITNGFYCTPLAQIKEFATKEDGWWLNAHNTALAKGRTFENTWPGVRNHLVNKYDLVDDEPVESTTTPQLPQDSNTETQYTGKPSELEAKLDALDPEKLGEDAFDDPDKLINSNAEENVQN